MRATRSLCRFLKPYWYWAVLAPLVMVVEVCMDLLQPRLVQQIIDVGIAHSDQAKTIHTALLMGGCALIGLVGGFSCSVFSVLAAQGFGTDLRHTLFRKVQDLSFGNLDRLSTGALITRLTNDVGQVQDLIMMGLRIMVRVPLTLAGSIVMGVMTSPKLSLLFPVLMPLVLAILFVVIRRTYPMFHQVQQRLDNLNTVLQENLSGIRVVKAFARAAFECDRFGKANTSLMNQNVEAVRASAVTMPSVMMVMHLAVVSVLWFGGVQVSRGGLQVGQVVAFINYLVQALFSLMMVSMLILRMARAEASAMRIEEVLSSVPEIRPAPNALRDAPKRALVAFENVTFGYDGAEQEPVLKDVSFVAEPGQTIALLGATGSGKSSLVNLIPRFYDVSDGRVTVDGVDVRDMDPMALRSRIGVALQETILFSGTIRDSIRLGRPEASNEEVEEAARKAQAHDFIQGFPEGYDTQLGQRGVNLSGGQKQRIAIARALLPNPSILILDDSTSAVDLETEARIQDALAADRTGGRTCFVVAQRITSVLGADKILVLDDGRIAAEGTHQELLSSSAIYRDIYESQMESEKDATDGK